MRIFEEIREFCDTAALGSNIEAEEPFGGPRVSFRAQQEIDHLSRRIDGMDPNW